MQIEAESEVGRSLRRAAFVQTAIDVREQLYVLAPLWKVFGDLSRAGADNEFIPYHGLVLALLTSGPADHDPEVRRTLFIRALRFSAARPIARLVLHRLAGEADVLAEDALVPIVGEISRWPHLADQLDLTAELIAAIRTRDPLSPVLRRWADEAADGRMHRYLEAARLKRDLSG
jgi:hypothetical protein